VTAPPSPPTPPQPHTPPNTGPAQLGIDIGGTSTKLLLRSRNGTERRLTTAPYARPTLDELAETVRAGLAELDLAETEPIVTGCCVPGKLAVGSSGRADTVAYSANLACLNGLDVGAFVSGVLAGRASHVAILPDSIATALGSHNAEPSTGRLLCLALGTGVGGALLVDGAPVTVAPGSVGHLGQLDVSLDDHAPLGPDGGRGSLEAYIGLPALRARFGESPEAVRDGIDTMDADDPALRALARALRIAHAIYTPDQVRLLGGIGALLSAHLDTIARLVNDSLTGVANRAWTLHAGDDPYDAASGAASIAASSLEED